MKKTQSQTGFAISKRVSITVSRIDQDASGMRTVNRAYLSTGKRIYQPDKSGSDLILEDSNTTERDARSVRRKEPEQGKQFTQLSMFPVSDE